MADDLPLVTKFESSAVTLARYRPDEATLEIRYKSGDLYSYLDVPEVVYRALRAAPSAGQFVNFEIKPNYRFEIERARKRFRPD
jgi:lysyl-tRNA synthetase class 2